MWPSDIINIHTWPYLIIWDKYGSVFVQPFYSQVLLFINYFELIPEFDGLFSPSIAQSAGAVEYTDCTSAEG